MDLPKTSPGDLLASAGSALSDAKVQLRMRAFRILKAGILTIPSPALLAVLSGSAIAMAGTAALLVAGLLLLVWPGGVMGLVLAMLVWAGSLALGSCGLRIAQFQTQIDQLEEEAHSLRETRQVWERDLLNRVKTAEPGESRANR